MRPRSARSVSVVCVRACGCAPLHPALRLTVFLFRRLSRASQRWKKLWLGSEKHTLKSRRIRPPRTVAGTWHATRWDGRVVPRLAHARARARTLGSAWDASSGPRAGSHPPLLAAHAAGIPRCSHPTLLASHAAGIPRCSHPTLLASHTACIPRCWQPTLLASHAARIPRTHARTHS
jgi:hypothetical protein